MRNMEIRFNTTCGRKVRLYEIIFYNEKNNYLNIYSGFVGYGEEKLVFINEDNFISDAKIKKNKSHSNNMKGKGNSNYKGGKPYCKVCGKQLFNYEATLCKECYIKTLEERSREEHPNYKNPEDRTTPIHLLIRGSDKYEEWRIKIFKRDNHTCQECGRFGGDLNAHHIKRFADILKDFNITTVEMAMGCNKLWDINNGITLCKGCHKKTDNFKNKIIE